MQRYNVVVIGGGSGGLMVAAGAAGLGARVALVERGTMGGDCLNTGCVPSKALIRSANTAALMRAGAHAMAPATPAFDWAGVAGRVQRVIGTIAPHDSVERFRALGVEVFQGSARLAAPRQVQVALNDGGTATLHARAIVIATGSRALVPPVPGLAEAGYLTNENVFGLADQPRRLAVIGGGPIGCELGQAFARLGSQVTLVEMERLLPREDADAAQVVAQAMARDGMTLHPHTVVAAVTHAPGGKRLRLEPRGDLGHAGEVEVDEILVAAGRRLNLEDLGLEAAGISHSPRGIVVDARLRTTAPGVYACGDVAGPYLFTHMANQQARVVIQNALLPIKARIDYRAVPWCTFTAPELSRVGLNELDAQAARTPYRTITVPFADVDRMVCDDAREGFLKVLTPPGRDDILGATMVGAHAGELIHELVLAMHAGLRLRDIASTIHIYPTMAEIFRRAGDESRKAGFTPRMQKLLAGYLRWARR